MRKRHAILAVLRAELAIAACAFLIFFVPSEAQIPSSSTPAPPRTKPGPGTEAALRRIIDGFVKGQPDIADMTPRVANAVQSQSTAIRSMFAQMGALTSLIFHGVGPDGNDIYEAYFLYGQTEWRIALGPNGKIAGLIYRPVSTQGPHQVPHPMAVNWPVLKLVPRSLTSGADDYWPCFSPDGKTVLFSRSTDGGQHWALYVISASGGEPRPLTAAPLSVSATRAAWSKSGTIAFTGNAGDQTAIWLVGSDGNNAHVVPNLTDGSEQLFYPSWYPDGTYIAAMDGKSQVIRRIDIANGGSSTITDHDRVLTGMPSVSPDGTLIAFAGQKNDGQSYNQEENVIWLVDTKGRLSTLEAKSIQGRTPYWSPDGKKLAFESDRGPNGQYAIFIINRDGTHLSQVTDYALNANHGVFSPNGKHMVFTALDPNSQLTNIEIVDLPEH